MFEVGAKVEAIRDMTVHDVEDGAMNLKIKVGQRGRIKEVIPVSEDEPDEMMCFITVKDKDGQEIDDIFVRLQYVGRSFKRVWH